MELFIIILLALLALPVAFFGIDLILLYVERYARKIANATLDLFLAALLYLDKKSDGFTSWLLVYGTAILLVNLVVWAFN